MDLVEPIEIPTNPVRFRLVLVQVQVEFVVVVEFVSLVLTFDVRSYLMDRPRLRKSGSKVRTTIVPAIALNKDNTE